MTDELTFGDSLKQFAYMKEKRSRKKRNVSMQKVTKSPSKKPPRRNKGYAPPEEYAHLQPLKPLLKPGLRCVFIGFNPGVMTALKGHYYAHHSNAFWKMIYESGCVDRKVSYLDDQVLPDEFKIGFTDLVERPTGGISELSMEEMHESVPDLERRISENPPGMIVIVGKGIWETIFKVQRHQSLAKSNFKLGYQENTQFGGCENVFVLPSTSGLVAGIPKNEKVRLWKEVGKFLNSNFPLPKNEPSPTDST